MTKKKLAPQLSATAAAAATKGIADAFLETDAAISHLRLRIHDFDQRRGWSAMGYDSFVQWSTKCLPWAKSRCYNLLTEAQVEARITAVGSPVEEAIPSRHLIAVARVPEDRQAFAYQKAVDLANAGNEGETVPPKQKHVVAAVRQVLAAATPQDSRGTPVSNDGMAAILEEAKAFDAVMGVLGRLKTSLTELAGTRAGAVLAGELATAERHRQELYRLVRFSRPFAECLYCRGTGEASGKPCRACRGRMWLTEAQMKQAPKQETQRDDDTGATTVPA